MQSIYAIIVLCALDMQTGAVHKCLSFEDAKGPYTSYSDCVHRLRQMVGQSDRQRRAFSYSYRGKGVVMRQSMGCTSIDKIKKAFPRAYPNVNVGEPV